MTPSLRKLLNGWLDWLAMGVILSTAFCGALLHFDVSDFASVTRGVDGGAAIRVTLWAVLCLLLAPAAAATDALFRDPEGR